MLATVYTLKSESDIVVREEKIGKSQKIDEATDFVKQIASFNCSKIRKNTKDVSIEFYFERPTCNTVNFIKNRVPLVSSITFLHDTPNLMAIFTDISFNVYKYKKYRNFENGKKTFVSIAEKQKHIIYNATNAFLFINRDNTCTEHVALFMNIFESNIDSPISDSLITDSLITNFSFVENKSGNIEVNNRFNFDFYENLLYQKNNDCLKFIWMIIDEGNKNLEFTETFDINAEKTKMLKTKYGDVIHDIIEINKSTFKLNRFFQRFHIKNVFQKNICKWFVDEVEKHVAINGWKTNNFENYKTTDVNLSSLKTIHDYFLNYELGNIMKLIEQSYCLPNESQFEITDLNIIKYSNELISGLNKHTDSAFITFNISLNSTSEYEGGGTYFDDGLTFQNDIGDALIHCGKIEHIGLPVKKGVRYILVGFINIKYEV